MSNRFMRVIVFFDLPMVSAADRAIYNKFRKFLIKDGYMMMQESVYCKLAANQNAANAIVDHLKNSKPSDGLVQVLIITEKQYANIQMIVGDRQSDIVDTTKRMLVL